MSYTNWYRVGLVNVVQGTTQVIGIGTRFLTAGIEQGATFRLDDDVVDCEVEAVLSDEELKLAMPYKGASGNGKTYSIDRNFQATTNAKIAAKVTKLISDYSDPATGASVDLTEIEDNISTLQQDVEGLKASVQGLQVGQGSGSGSSSGSGSGSGSSGEIGATGAAAEHNKLLSNEFLGETITAEQSEAIRAGTFEGIRVGDYWEKAISVKDIYKNREDLIVFRNVVAHCDYRLGRGTDQHHVAVVPEFAVFIGGGTPVIPANVTAGGYAGTPMFSTYLKGAEDAFKKMFGEDHLVPYTLKVSNSVNTASPYNVLGWIEAKNRICDLLSARQVFGDKYDLMTTMGNMDKQYLSYLDQEEEQEQLAIFKLNKDFVKLKLSTTNTAVQHWWLRDHYLNVNWAFCNTSGEAQYAAAKTAYYARPMALVN